MKLSSSTSGALRLECFILFFLLPFIVFAFRQFIASKVVPILLVVGLFCFTWLWFEKSINRAELFLTTGWKHVLITFGCFFIPITAVTLAATSYFWPQYLLTFPKTHPGMWLIVMLLYPILAAFPQELIFRTFFFHRYSPVFSSDRQLIIINGLSFSLFHLFYGNWVAPVLTLAGGWLFAYRYAKTRSLVLISLEHGLWGNMLFTVGLGYFFYSGAIR